MSRTSFEQMQRFNRTSPVPARRRRSPDKPVPSVLSVTHDFSRGLALLRGTDVPRIMALTGAERSARWSPGSRGWVIASSDVPDVLASASWLGTRVHTKEVVE